MLKPTSFTDTQELDCCAPADLICNDITVTVEDGGGGNYLVISTQRWALDDEKDIDRFAKALKKCLKDAE